MYSVKSVEICIPAYNEAAVIAATVSAIAAVCKKRSDIAWHIIVADNGSTDGTAKVVTAQGIATALVVPGKGKGRAVRFAAEHSTSDVFVYIDADLSVDPEHILEFVSELERDSADIVVGSRLLDAEHVERGLIRTLSSVFFQMYMQLVIPVGVLDTQCPLKALNITGRRALIACEETTWFFDIEFLARAYRRKLRIIEAPIRWYEQRYPERKSKLSVISGGLGALVAAWRIRLNIRYEPLS